MPKRPSPTTLPLPSPTTVAWSRHRKEQIGSWLLVARHLWGLAVSSRAEEVRHRGARCRRLAAEERDRGTRRGAGTFLPSHRDSATANAMAIADAKDTTVADALRSADATTAEDDDDDHTALDTALIGEMDLGVTR